MKALIILSLIYYCLNNFINEEAYNTINRLADWELYDMEKNPHRHYSHHEIHKRLMNEDSIKKDVHYYLEASKSDVLSFDSRVKWPLCVFPVRDQGSCGSCWAFAASETLTDRFCIASNETIKVVLSPQNMVSCDKNDNGCNGGGIETSWDFLVFNGVVSDQCFPYYSSTGSVPPCPNSLCINKAISNRSYSVVSGTSRYFNGLTSIQNEIIKNGPLESAFTVYEDFYYYRSGIYRHVYGGVVGGHAIKVVGWGTYSGTGYWIVQNSWGPLWGENGFFRIAMGECYIDQNFYGGEAKLNN